MSRRILVQDVFKEWKKDPVFRAEYDALADEFTLATALIKARDAAHMPQEEVAQVMSHRPPFAGHSTTTHVDRSRHAFENQSLWSPKGNKLL